MMYRISLRALLLLFIALFPPQICSEDSSKEPIQEKTFLVYRRYYFIARLDRTIQTLAHLYQGVDAMQKLLLNKKINFDTIVPPEAYRLFKHRAIRESVKEMAHTRTLKPLFMVWDSFASYKSLHDELLVEDFSKEIFIITRNTIEALHQKTSYSEERSVTCEDRFDAISSMTDVLQGYMPKMHPVHRVRVEKMSDIKLAIHTDEVAFRFYCIQRLKEAFALLSDKVNMHEDHRKKFMKLKDDVEQYKHIDNKRCVHNLAVYVHVLLQALESDPPSYKSLSQNNFIELYHQVEQLPLEEILQSIDIIVKQLNLAVHHYQKSGLTLSKWIQQYWWVPTAICSTVAIKLFIFYHNNFRS
jgi:hypothetical protein